MASSRALKRSFNPLQLGMTAANATTGVWTLALSAAGAPSGAISLHKAAAATTSVVHIGIPHGPSDRYNDDAQVTTIEAFYLVTTADLSSAPTAVLNKMTYPGGAGTGLAALAAVTQGAIAYAGADAIGIANGAGAAGSHIAVVTIATPFTLADSDNLHLKLTMNEAATSVLDFFGITVTYR